MQTDDLYKGMRKNYDGMRFEHFTIIKRDHRNEHGEIVFLCKCDCGREFYDRMCNFKRRKSCGCMTHDAQVKAHYRHGGSKTRLYNIWRAMLDRCNNSNNERYLDYGGRGISVCPEWHKFEAFREWALENHYDENAKIKECTIDRINVNGNYEPGNCRWTDAKTQNNNRRDNHKVTINGETHTISEWAKIKGIDQDLIYRRIAIGWSDEKAVVEPIRPTRKELHEGIYEYIKEYGGITHEEFESIFKRTRLDKHIIKMQNEGYKIGFEWKYKNGSNRLVDRYKVYKLEGYAL